MDINLIKKHIELTGMDKVIEFTEVERDSLAASLAREDKNLATEIAAMTAGSFNDFLFNNVTFDEEYSGPEQADLFIPVVKAFSGKSVRYVIADYDGSGDDGQIGMVRGYSDSNITELTSSAIMKNCSVISLGFTVPWCVPTTWRDGCAWETVEIIEEVSAEKVLDDVAYDLLEFEHPGWGDNEGCEGAIIMDLMERRIVFEHGYRVQALEYEITTHKF